MKKIIITMLLATASLASAQNYGYPQYGQRLPQYGQDYIEHSVTKTMITMNVRAHAAGTELAC